MIMCKLLKVIKTILVLWVPHVGAGKSNLKGLADYGRRIDKHLLLSEVDFYGTR